MFVFICQITCLKFARTVDVCFSLTWINLKWRVTFIDCLQLLVLHGLQSSYLTNVMASYVSLKRLDKRVIIMNKIYVLLFSTPLKSLLIMNTGMAILRSTSFSFLLGLSWPAIVLLRLWRLITIRIFLPNKKISHWNYDLYSARLIVNLFVLGPNFAMRSVSI